MSGYAYIQFIGRTEIEGGIAVDVLLDGEQVSVVGLSITLVQWDRLKQLGELGFNPIEVRAAEVTR